LTAKLKESGVTQVQIHPKIGLTFASALRASLRQDPDILMVGEIRDQETADIAMRAAMTGHLVFSTLHTNSATETITRLRDIGIEPYLIASTLLGVLAQRLARILCLDCRQPYTPPPRALRGILPEGLPSGSITLYKAKGCPRCQGTGYKGRTGIFEFLEMDEGLRRAVLEGAGGDEIRHLARERGMKSLRTRGMELVLKGTTTVEEVLRVTAEE
jgi:type II secretory ATPase GspE/PulE/Tfp pilus assembly ATPase PilB-like protein